MASFPVNYAGNVYDIRSFLRDHPGGVRTLEKYRGRSIAQVMRVFGHSYSAYHMLNDFKISDGNLTGSISENGRIITKDEADMDEKEIAFLEELESRLDWSKPLLRQLHKIAPHYQKWVNSAVYRKCRLFESPLMEGLTYTPWYLVPIFWIPVIIYMGVTQFFSHVYCGDCTTSITEVEFVLHMAIGFMVWTFLEYSLHRWVFHYDPGSSIKLIQMHFLIHGMHHKVPFDGLRQVFPPVPALVIASILFLPIWCTLSYPWIKMSGGLIGYLVYDMIHYYVHHGSPRDGTYLYAMKRYHSNHHFVNHNKAFGISNKLWDYVFKTLVHVKKLGFGLQW